MREPLGVVLAGGASRRFGRRKATEPLAGRPMAGWALRALAPHAAPLGVAGEAAVGRLLGVEARADARPGGGPLEGLRTALAWAADEGRSGALVLACDLPLVPPELVGELAESAARAGGGTAVVPASRGPLGVEPLCGFYPVVALGAVEGARVRGEGALHRLLELLEPRVLPLERVTRLVEPDEAFLNVNTPEAAGRAGTLLADRGAAPAALEKRTR